MSTFVIGDIHGNLQALHQVLDRSSFNNKVDKIIFLGDYVDGYPESAELIEFLINLQNESNNNHIFIRGNHDKWCEDWLLFGIANKIWTSQGGKSTIDSYIKTSYILNESHKLFFKNLHNYYIDDLNRGFVHGGYRSRKGLGHEAYQSDYYWDRDLWTIAMMMHEKKLDKEDGIENTLRFYKHKELYIGHTSTFNWKCKPHYPEYSNPNQEIKNGGILVPMNRCNVWNLDTGAGYHGKLTMLNIDTKEYFQSDLAHILYPNHYGR